MNAGVTREWFFRPEEFACSCGCGLNNVDFRLAYYLNEFRREAGKPLSITSGCRCVKRNREAGGASASQHVAGASKPCRAADVAAAGMSSEALMKLIEEWDTAGVFRGRGLYPGRSFIHVDARNAPPARWICRNGVYATVEKFNL